MANVGANVAIIGFGFAGLATLMQVVTQGSSSSVVVIAEDQRGLGIAYGTTDREHLLNVQANRMGAWAQEPEHFAGWLAGGPGQAACRELDLPVPAPTDFAPRMLYGRYLTDLRAAVLAQARGRGVDVRFLGGSADRLTRRPDGWTVHTEGTIVEAGACVLAIGHERRPVFGPLRHPCLFDGPGALAGAGEPARTLVRTAGPIALIGSGLTAIDSVLTLRGAGYRGEIVALSRNGRLPAAHRRGVTALALGPEELDRLMSLDAVIGFIRDAEAAGHDWRSAVDALRPHAWRLWQRLPPADQRLAVNRWSSRWSVLRHRMAPSVAARVEAERRCGGLRVLATRSIEPQPAAGDRADAESLTVRIEARDGPASELRCAAVIDCTGLALDVAETRRPLLRGLLSDGLCTPHHTGRGLAADADHRVGVDLYATGSLLAGQLWESVAVPELRRQAETVAARLAAGGPATRYVAA